MIVCANCGSPQCLQITASRVWFDEGVITEITETFECTLCKAEGMREVWHEDGTKRTSITGEIEETEDRPRVA